MQGLQEANFHKDTAPERKGMGILVIRGFHSKKEEQRSEMLLTLKMGEGQEHRNVRPPDAGKRKKNGFSPRLCSPGPMQRFFLFN